MGVLRFVFNVCDVTTAASEFHNGLLDGTHSSIRLSLPVLALFVSKGYPLMIVSLIPWLSH